MNVMGRQPRTQGAMAAAVAGALLSLATMSGAAFAQSSDSSVRNEGGIPLLTLIETVSKQTGKNFVVDPRVTGNATLVGIDAAKITYPQLLTVLQVHGFAAVEIGAITRIVPDSGARTLATPIVSGNDKRADTEVVTRVIRVKSIPAAQLVPILRPLLPQNAHLAAFPCTNELVLVDSYANIRRVESVIASMDKGDPLALEKCAHRVPGLAGDGERPPSSPSPQGR
jgi:general secretion pathway protein D